MSNIFENKGAMAATIVVAASNSLNRGAANYVCDGTADQVEINAAIAAVVARGGGQVLLLEGTYNITAQITLYSRVTLSGVGYSKYPQEGYTRLFQVNGSNLTNIIYLNDNSISAGVSDLYIDANVLNNAGMVRAVGVWTNIDARLTNISITNAKTGIETSGGNMAHCHNLFVDAPSIIGLRVTGGDHHVFSMCGVFGGQYGIRITTNAVNHNFIGLRAWNQTIVCLDLEDARECSFTGCHFDSINGTGRHCVVLAGSARNIFNGCILNDVCGETNNTYYGFRLLSHNGDHSTHNIIANCIMFTDIANKPAYWIYEADGNQNYNTYERNVLIAAVTAPLYISGLNTVYAINHPDLFMDVLGITANHVRNNEDLSAAIPIAFTIDAQPDVPRTLSFTLTNANITAFTLVIVGVNAKGQTVTETFTEAGGFTQETNHAYATVTSITLTARTGTGVGDLGDVGITDVLGLSNNIYATGDVYKIKKNNANAVVAAAQVNVTYDTYDMAVIGLAVGDDFTIWFRNNLNVIG